VIALDAGQLQQFADQGGYPIGLFAHPRQCLVALVPLTCQLDREAEPGQRGTQLV
jgi:hypothetical protein